MRPMTLGEAISALDRKNPEHQVKFEFCDYCPAGLESWRGDYSELAITYASDGSMTVATMLKMLKDALGETFQGYKGGDFVMDDGTRMWVDLWSRSTCTALTDIVDGQYSTVYLRTAHCEY